MRGKGGEDTVKKPTVGEVKKSNEEYLSNFHDDIALELLIRTYPENKDEKQVLVKVAAINALFSAGVRYVDLAVMAKHIINISNFDVLLKEGDAELVGKLVDIEGYPAYYSFATKYCHLHSWVLHPALKKSFFPIYDSRVDQFLWECRKEFSFEAFERKDLWVYPDLVKIFKAFVKYFGLSSCSLREIDRYLWMSKE